MSSIALVAFVVVAFIIGLAVGVLAVAVCVSGAREDAWRRGYMCGLHSGRRKERRNHKEATR